MIRKVIMIGLKKQDIKALKVLLWKVLGIILYDYALPNSILSTTKYFTILKVRTDGIFCTDFFLVLLFVFSKDIDGISVYIFQRMRKGGEIMNPSSFEHIVRIQFNALIDDDCY